jgi:uncharacterized membrane protein YfcA
LDLRKCICPPIPPALPDRRRVADALANLAIVLASVISGMLGIGVAFAALPILSLGGGDLVHELQPVCLFLNAVTALFSAFAFWRAGYVDGRPTAWISLVATVVAPFGALAAQAADARLLWYGYIGAVMLVLGLSVAGPPKQLRARSLALVLVAAVPISLFSAMLGIGPGFLLVPVMLFAGWSARSAAAANAVAVVPSSLAALVPHLPSATVDVARYAPIVALAAAAALVGGHLASRRVPERALRLLFSVSLAGLALYKALSLYGS